MAVNSSDIILPQYLEDGAVKNILKDLLDFDGLTYKTPLSYYIHNENGLVSLDSGEFTEEIEDDIVISKEINFETIKFIDDFFYEIDPIIDLDFQKTHDSDKAIIDIYSVETINTEDASLVTLGFNTLVWGTKDSEYYVVDDVVWTTSEGDILNDYDNLSDKTASTIIHELLHSLGLNHPNDDPWGDWHTTNDTLMSYNYISTSPDHPIPTSIDKAALIEIWGSEINRLNVNDGDAFFKIDDSAKILIGSELSIVEVYSDPEGTGELDILWEVSSDMNSWDILSNSQNLIFDKDYEGQYLRAVISYIDGDNFSESVTTSTLNLEDFSPKIIGDQGETGFTEVQFFIDENIKNIYTFSSDESVIWTIYSGDDFDKFEIDPDKGALSFLTSPDYENPHDSDKLNDYVIQIRATDSIGNASDVSVQILINDLDDTIPSIIGPSGSAGNATSTQSINENTTSIHTFKADETVSWSLNGGFDSALFTIDPLTGALSFGSAPDYESPTDSDSNNSYIVDVRAIDSADNTSDQTLTVSINDLIDETPTDISLSASSIDENIKAESVVATLLTSDQDSSDTHTYKLVSGDGDTDNAEFTILDNQLKINTSPDYEAQSSYSIRLQTIDSGGLLYQQVVTLNVNNLIEDGLQVATVNTDYTPDSKGFTSITGLTPVAVTAYEIGKESKLDSIKDYDGNLHAGDNLEETASSYKYQGMLDVNGDGTFEAIFTNKVSKRWVTAKIDSVTGQVDFDDNGASGGTRVVGIYEDPLIAEGADNGGFLSDGVTPAPANFGVSEEERYVEVNGETIDRLALNSQVRFQNDLDIDNLQAKHSGDYDSDGVSEVYWKTADGTAYLRALMHADGNIRYANYQSEAQMTDYLTTQGHESVVSQIV